MNLYVQIRQEYLRLSFKNINTSSCTIFVTNVLYDLLFVERFDTIYDKLLKDVKIIYIN